MTQWVDFITVREHFIILGGLTHYGITAHGTEDRIKIICSFHDDHKPFCGVNFRKQVYNCSACHAAGNALDFMAHMEGLDPSQTAVLHDR